MLPTWIRKEVPSSFDSMKVHPTMGNGNCLFDSFNIMLSSVKHPVDPQSLRKFVALTVMDEKDEKTNETIKSWLEIFKGIVQEKHIDKSLYREYMFMKGLEHAHWPFSLEQRTLLFNNMMNPSLYWGEQHAVRVLEEYFRIRMLVFCSDFQTSRLCWNYNSSYKPICYGVLLLSGQHYQPVSINRKFIWAWTDMPRDVRFFFVKPYTQEK